jgi:hypothetical protein
MKMDFEKCNTIFRECITNSCGALLARELGVSPESLDELGIGWSNLSRSHTFPIYGTEFSIIGIQHRSRQGKKYFMEGTNPHGLFVPGGYTTLPRPTLLLEGISDTAAARTMGFNALGRLNWGTGSLEVLKWYLDDHPVFIVADLDAPGLRGAYQLKEQLNGIVPMVRVLTLPSSDSKIKDLRGHMNTTGRPKLLHWLLSQIQEVCDVNATN